MAFSTNQQLIDANKAYSKAKFNRAALSATYDTNLAALQAAVAVEHTAKAALDAVIDGLDPNIVATW